MVARVRDVLSLALLGAVLLGGQCSLQQRWWSKFQPPQIHIWRGCRIGTKSTYGDSAPRQSPVLVETSLTNAAAVSVVASGAINHYPGCPTDCDPPQGSSIVRHANGAEHGISDIAAPINSLLGVFLGDDRPDRSRAPKSLDFGAIGTEFRSISPKLKQVFFFGRGATRAGIAQRFVVPKVRPVSSWVRWTASGGITTPAPFRLRLRLSERTYLRACSAWTRPFLLQTSRACLSEASARPSGRLWRKEVTSNTTFFCRPNRSGEPALPIPRAQL